MTIKHVVSYSTGTSSAIAADRVLQRYNRDSVDIVFSDTKWEHEDNYRFMQDCEARWNKSITVLTDGRTPMEVWDDKQLIPNSLFAPCTYELKIKPMIAYVKQLQADGFTTIMHIGMNYRDAKRGRCKAPLRNWKRVNTHVSYPLLWRGWGMVDNTDHANRIVLQEWGIKPPQMYSFGFDFGNCGGRCPKGGVNAWRRTLTHFPADYDAVERWEREKRRDPRFADHTILKRRRGGETIRLSLEDLRIETEQSDGRQMTMFTMLDDMTNACSSECGVNAAWDDE